MSNATETHIETVANLRGRLMSMLDAGGISDDGSYQLMLAMYNKILNEVESARIKHETECVRLERQAAAEKAKAEGCRTLRTVIYNAVNEFAMAAENDLAQKKALEKLRDENPEDDDEDEDEDDESEDDESEDESARIDAIRKRQENSLQEKVSKVSPKKKKTVKKK